MDVADALWLRAKKEAASSGRPVTRVVEDALRQYFAQSERGAEQYRFRVRIPKNAGRLVVDPADREAWNDAMDDAQ